MHSHTLLVLGVGLKVSPQTHLLFYGLEFKGQSTATLFVASYI
jgi:hypothetical protein